MSLPQALIEKVTERLIDTVNPYCIYLFGSYGNGTIHSNSDVDIAYLTNFPISHYDRFLLAQKLASLINKEVDLIDLKEASTVFQVQIITSGKVLYCSNDLRKDEFEMISLKKYARLNEERKMILDQIEESGQVYES